MYLLLQGDLMPMEFLFQFFLDGEKFFVVAIQGVIYPLQFLCFLFELLILLFVLFL
jgi:hypothetical protein